MTPTAWGALTLVPLLACLASALVSWRRPLRSVGVTMVLALALAAALAAGAPDIALDHRWARALLVALAGGCAVAGGGPLTTLVFESIDRHDPNGQLRDAGQVLRGGAWIGGLERVAVFASLVAGWPEGLAVALAVKGLGRYAELRAGDRSGAAERFIIGTLVSVLWAAACAGIVQLVLSPS